MSEKFRNVGEKKNMKRQGHINEFIQAYWEFQNRRLWKRFDNSHCLAVEVAGEEEPLLASVLGAADEEYGLMLLRGPEAVDQMRSFQSFDDQDDSLEEADMLSISLEAFVDLSPDIQAFYRQAGIHPRYDEEVPLVLIKPPCRKPRLPDDDELILLLSVLESIVEADRRKRLIPAELDDGEGICVVTPAGMKGAEISVHRERLPRRPPPAKEIDFFLSPRDLDGLGLIEETWLVGTPIVPFGIKGEDRTMRFLLVVEENSGMVLEGRPFFADRMKEAISMLAEAFHGTRLSGDRKGIPRRIVFSSRKLHDAALPALLKVGVQCEHLPSIPVLQEIVDNLIDSFGESGPWMDEDPSLEDPIQEEVPAPDDLARWKEADRRLCRRFEELLRTGNRLRSERASRRYFGDPDYEYFLMEHEDLGVAMAYASWGVLDYRPTWNSKTEAEKMLDRGLTPAQEVLLRARMEAHPSVYRVAGHDPEAGEVELEDVLLGGAVKIRDQLLSENISNNMFLPCRVYEAGRFHFLDMVGPPLGAGMGLEAVEFLAECEMEFTREGLRRDAHLFGWLWDWFEEWRDNWEPPHLTNTDGDELLWHTASFSVADQESTRRAMRKRRDLDYDEEEDEFIWLRKTSKKASHLDGPIVLGRIEFIGGELVLTVNSVERFEKARKWLGRLPGIRFLNVTTRRMDEPEEDRPMDDRIAKTKPVEFTEEMAAALQEKVDKQSMAWLDVPIPALGGITPRQACRNIEGRRKVALLIRTMPDPIADAPVHVPREAMLRSLGLESELEREADLGSSLSPSLVGSAPPLSREARIGRNDPCPCGSGKKYKKCCGR